MPPPPSGTATFSQSPQNRDTPTAEILIILETPGSSLTEETLIHRFPHRIFLSIEILWQWSHPSPEISWQQTYPSPEIPIERRVRHGRFSESSFPKTREPYHRNYPFPLIQLPATIRQQRSPTVGINYCKRSPDSRPPFLEIPPSEILCERGDIQRRRFPYKSRLSLFRVPGVGN